MRPTNEEIEKQADDAHIPSEAERQATIDPLAFNIGYKEGAKWAREEALKAQGLWWHLVDERIFTMLDGRKKKIKLEEYYAEHRPFIFKIRQEGNGKKWRVYVKLHEDIYPKRAKNRYSMLFDENTEDKAKQAAQEWLNIQKANL